LLRVLRSTSGDGEVAFLAGYAAAIDANDQLSGNPLAGGPDALTSKFHERAVCFTGAWIRNLAERQLLDAGDDQELARAAETFAPYGDVPRQMLQLGYDEGAAACQEQVQG
jgi:predicted metalloprotease